MFSPRALFPLLLLPLTVWAQPATQTAASPAPAAQASSSTGAQASAPAALPASPAAAKPGSFHTPRHVLVIGEADDFQHDTIPDAMVAVYTMGHDTGLWDTTIRTDVRLLRNDPPGRNVHGLPFYDCIVFASASGDLPLDDAQKHDLLAAIHDDGKCFIGIHASLTSGYHWPEFGTMQGGYFDQHPWNTFDAPIRNEQPDFPAVRHFPKQFSKVDEIYQPRSWSRDDVNVLLSLDPSRWSFPPAPNLHRTDRDFAVAWAKLYGKGRVFYSTLGHTHESWLDPDIRTMYFEAIKWGLRMTEGSTASHPMPK